MHPTFAKSLLELFVAHPMDSNCCEDGVIVRRARHFVTVYPGQGLLGLQPGRRPAGAPALDGGIPAGVA